MSDEPTRFYTPDEVSYLLHVSQNTLRKWRKDRIGPKFIRVANVIRYPSDYLEEFLAQHSGKEVSS